MRAPWTARRSNQSVLKEISPEIYIGRINAESEMSILWPPDAKSQLIGKDPDAGKDWSFSSSISPSSEYSGLISFRMD